MVVSHVPDIRHQVTAERWRHHAPTLHVSTLSPPACYWIVTSPQPRCLEMWTYVFLDHAICGQYGTKTKDERASGSVRTVEHGPSARADRVLSAPPVSSARFVCTAARLDCCATRHNTPYNAYGAPIRECTRCCGSKCRVWSDSHGDVGHPEAVSLGLSCLHSENSTTSHRTVTPHLVSLISWGLHRTCSNSYETETTCNVGRVHGTDFLVCMNPFGPCHDDLGVHARY